MEFICRKFNFQQYHWGLRRNEATVQKISRQQAEEHNDEANTNQKPLLK